MSDTVLYADPTANGGMRIERVYVTPEIAQEWLDRPPPRQRRIMDNRTRHLGDAMRAGRWFDDAVAPIQLARDGGWVIDGRHRLQAIVDTGDPHTFIVAFNVDPATFDVIDDVAPRTPAHVLEADGLKNARTLEAVARLMHSWLRGAAEFRTSPPRARILDLARKYDGALQPLFPVGEKAARQTLVRVAGGRQRNPMPKAMATFCAFLEGGSDGLIGQLADWPEEELYDHPANAVALLRTALTKRASSGGDISKRAVISLFVMAKNLDHTGAAFPPKGLIYKSAAAFPTPEWPAALTWGADHTDGDDDD